MSLDHMSEQNQTPFSFPSVNSRFGEAGVINGIIGDMNQTVHVVQRLWYSATSLI